MYTSNPASNKAMSSFYKYTTIICIISAFLSTMIDIVHETIAYIKDQDSSDTEKFGIWLTAADLAYFNASIFLYLLIIGKLILTFKGTTYEVSRKYVVFLGLLICISIFSMIQYLIAINTKETITFLYNSVKFVYAVIFSDFVIDISVLALFVYKLQQLLVDTVDVDIMAPSIYAETKDETMDKYSRKSVEEIVRVSTDEYNLENNQKRLLALITRQSVLGSIIIFWNSSFYFKVLVDRYIINDNTFPSDLAFQTSHCLRALENFVIIWMIYLNFNFNTKLYYKSCGCCHNGCYQCCVKCTRRKITNKTMNVYQRL